MFSQTEVLVCVPWYGGQVYSTSADLRDSEFHEGDATMASESPATEAEGRETQSDRGSEGIDLDYPRRTNGRGERTSREGSTAGTPRARGVVEGLRSPAGAAAPSGRGLRTSNSSGRLPVAPPGLRSSGVVVSPSSQRSGVQQSDVQQREMERVMEDNQRLRRQLDSQVRRCFNPHEAFGDVAFLSTVPTVHFLW